MSLHDAGQFPAGSSETALQAYPFLLRPAAEQSFSCDGVEVSQAANDIWHKRPKSNVTLKDASDGPV